MPYELNDQALAAVHDGFPVLVAAASTVAAEVLVKGFTGRGVTERVADQIVAFAEKNFVRA
jgi:hypothetical protein